MPTSVSSKSATTLNVADVQQRLKRMVNLFTGFDVADIDESLNLLSFGFDSLKLIKLAVKINDDFRVDIPLRMLFDTLNTVEKIAAHIENNSVKLLNVEEVPIMTHGPTSVPAVPTYAKSLDLKALQSVFKDQLEIISEQNRIINSIIVVPDDLKKAAEPKSAYLHNDKPLEVNWERNMITDERQIQYVKSIESKILEFTKQSKRIITEHRQHYADNRHIAGFKPRFKEMVFPLIKKSVTGSRFIDIDGNELIDICMGFGAHLFGHNPDFIKHAMAEVMHDRMALGPDNMLTGEVAGQIAELTGAERVVFFNTGTEANMVALRLSRTVTKKMKIVIFSLDGLLGTEKEVPVGIPDSRDLWILNYGDDESLNLIEDRCDEIAAILVEPDRFPQLQPAEFLHKLRALTLERNIALIFDEITTGFRILAGGAQQYFGVQADIVTYGKIVGGGLSIGVVSGKASYLDRIGSDDSPPHGDGHLILSMETFSPHPLTMAAAGAVLKHISKHKAILYNELNSKTERMIAEMNTLFSSEDIPMKIMGIGSLFRFIMDNRFDIFYLGLIEKGIYLLDGRNCFLSTEHSVDDIHKVEEAIKRTVMEMKDANFFGVP